MNKKEGVRKNGGEGMLCVYLSNYMHIEPVSQSRVLRQDLMH